MAHAPDVVPWKALAGENGAGTAAYIVPFDRNGVCTGPQTADAVVAEAARATDVFLFSHGWNNDWTAATRRYDAFITHYLDVRRQWWSHPDRDYRPLLAGMFWPSAVLVAPGEEAPAIAGDAPAPDPESGSDGPAPLTEHLAPAQAERLRRLAGRDRLDERQAAELAALVAPALAGGDELRPDAGPPTAEQLIEIWARLPADRGRSRGRTGGFVDEDATAPPEAAGGLGFLDPRKLIRTATVLLMKDRAGRVGGHGVALLLRAVLDAAPDVRVHLVGHSYGCKVVLSALCNGPAPARPVESVLLLQPAVSGLCFAADVDGAGTPGGYRPALARTAQPVVTTFSRHDLPLTTFFHWAVRRPDDLGDIAIAGAPPSRYAALGGFGPQGVDGQAVTVDVKDPPDRYGLGPQGPRIVAVRADRSIGGHGDVTNPATAWALLCQVMG
ncbi:hypothetical protein OG871_33190 [Kitasatospora sp. NBC_00374]|uniref:hypothetical protein n=1 Tax=Kitasatospora sp. NBC_00374 TaxID=2975964 RepID=UPI0030E14FA7